MFHTFDWYLILNFDKVFEQQVTVPYPATTSLRSIMLLTTQVFRKK